MKRILLIATGGTIASGKSDDGLVPILKSEDILHYLGDHIHDMKLTCEDLLRLDSSNMQPEEWILIAKHIARGIHQYDGIVISHGTDTMAYTACALSFMLRNLTIPVILTGSQLSLLHPLSDGVDNIRTAFAAVLSNIQGVYVAFNRKIMLGTRAVKVRTMNFDAFESVNIECSGQVDARGLQFHGPLVSTKGNFQLQDQLCKDVFLIKCTPGMNPAIFDALKQIHVKGIVIEAFGAGGINFIRRDLIKKLDEMVKHGISVVVCSQCLYENSDFSIYQTGKRVLAQGVIQGYDMTSEACLCKLMWALGQTKNIKEVRRIFATNYVNEIHHSFIQE